MEPKKLTKILVDRGLVERFAIDQLLVKLEPKETLADRLVSDSLISEADLLRAIAQATSTKFISSPRLLDLQLAPSVLAMIPLEAAQAHDVLPLSYTAANKALQVAIADPARLSALDDLPTVGNLDHVIANVSLPGAIRAAIHRVYGVDRKPVKAAAPPPSGKCSQCKEPYFDDQLECAKCGLLLNANAPTDSSEARIVRALLSQPSGLHKMLSRAQMHEGATRRGFVAPVTEAQVPMLVAGLDIARSLSEFEAFMVSFVDGAMTVGELSTASGLMAVEVMSVFASLRERKVLELKDPPPPPPPPPAITPAELPPMPAPVTAPTPPVPFVPMPGRGPNPRRAAKAKAAKPAPPPPPAPAAKPIDAPLQARHLDPKVQMENSLQHALALERRGQADGAISVLRIAISRAPQPGPLYNRLALVILNQRKDAKQAEELLQKALELEPDNAVYKQNLFKVLSFAATKR
jgi:hypothetical protein